MSTKIESAARAAADESKLPVVGNERLRAAWSKAMAKAPWPRPPLSEKHEQAYREAFAAELVRRGIAREQGICGGSGGTHQQSRIYLRAPAEEVAGFKAKAESAGKTLTDWILSKLRAK